MAFNTSQPGGSYSSLAEINVTPLVDVVLVLLIIFMITAPVIQSGIEVQVPRTHSVRQLTEERLVVTVDRAQNVYLGDHVTSLARLPGELQQKLLDPSRQSVYVRADERVPWGALAQVMDALKQGGLKNVSLVTQPYNTPLGTRAGGK
jgi:biopolymer transport protein TolR